MDTAKRTATKVSDTAIFRDLVPLNSLSDEHFREISKSITVEDVSAGRYLFGAGDNVLVPPDACVVPIVLGLIDQVEDSLGLVPAGDTSCVRITRLDLTRNITLVHPIDADLVEPSGQDRGWFGWGRSDIYYYRRR